MTILWVDFETKSRCNLLTRGVYNYAQDLSTEVLCMSYAFGDNDVITWTPDMPFPDAIMRHEGMIYAHNATFERLIFWYVLQINFKLEQFYCTATQARANCAPGSLEDVGRFAGASMRKDFRGSQLVRALSIPQGDDTFNDDPVLMKEMVEYCEQDVRVMRVVSAALRPLSEEELLDYHVSERINDRGVRVDVPLARAAIKYASIESKEIQGLVSELTGGEITSVRSPRMREWVLERVGDDALKLMETFKDGEKKYSIDKALDQIYLYSPMKTQTRFRPMLQTSFNARTTSGRVRLRSSAAYQSFLMTRIRELEARLSLLGGAPLEGLQAMAHKSITLLESVLKSLTQLEQQWLLEDKSYQIMVAEQQMSLKGCFALH